MLDSLKANRALTLFGEMCEIPHGSSDTKKISDYLKNFAINNNLFYIQDSSNNIIIKKPASLGKEKVMPLIIQAHMDMVCEKDEDVIFDFKKDALKLEIDGDFLYAKGTTLGGDDISGVAIGLAILEDNSLSTGEITCVFTVDEEIGMLGAIALDKSVISMPAYLLNIDNEKEGQFLTSCAGGIMVEGRLPLSLIEKTGYFYELTVSGCVGGHSGESIHKKSANAVKVLGKLIDELNTNNEIYLSSINGGLKDNAIPRKATAVFYCDLELIEEKISELSKNIINRYKNTDPDLSISIIKSSNTTGMVIDNTLNVLSYINDVPDGVINFSENIEGMVETSLNLGVLKTEENEIYICHLLRSSISNSLKELQKTVENTFSKNGFTAKAHSGYPGWEHKVDSKFREIIKNTARMLDFPCEFEGIHAGLECGVFFEANPDLDIVSMGPDIFDIHTPSEKMSISSFNRCYEFAKALAQNID